jgi:hypothetical protein
VIIVLTTSGAAGVVVVSAVTESAAGVSSLVPPPPQEVKKNAMAAKNSRPGNVNRFIEIDFIIKNKETCRIATMIMRQKVLLF